MTDHIARIRAHVEAHKGRERATFSIEGIKALLAALDDAALDNTTSSQLVQELQWYGEKKRWPKGLAPLGGLIKQAIAALSAADPGTSAEHSGNTGNSFPKMDRSFPEKGEHPGDATPSVAVIQLPWVKNEGSAFWRAEVIGLVYEVHDDAQAEIKKRQCQNDFDARIRSTLSPHAQNLGQFTNDQREAALLLILDGMGGQSDASESEHSWVNWFCSDEIPNVQSDTLNRCMENGWLRYSHDTNTDHGTIYLSPLGRAMAAKAGAESHHDAAALSKQVQDVADMPQSPWPASDWAIGRIKELEAQAAPEGWKLVPVEPTEEMEKAGRKEAADCDDTYGSSLFSAAEIYRAMLAAAPSKQEGGE